MRRDWYWESEAFREKHMHPGQGRLHQQVWADFARVIAVAHSREQ
ncbi:MAG TPA: hypothetical protein VE860_19375 [Chthoniobacterales bacterium]|nr:hypothetical protein [Chthoniobacterales bacterium]